MILFCLLWVPMFYFLIRSISIERENRSGWALFLGGVAVILLILFGEFIEPVDFGIYRWLNGFVDIVSLPALLPFFICLLLAAIKKNMAETDFLGFALLWLVPFSLYRSGDWSSLGTPLMLVLVPVLWTIQVCGIAFFIEYMIQNPKIKVIIPSVIGIITIPIIAATSWWEFFSNSSLSGSLLMSAIFLPASISLIFRIKKRRLKEKPLLIPDLTQR